MTIVQASVDRASLKEAKGVTVNEVVANTVGRVDQGRGVTAAAAGAGEARHEGGRR